MNLTSLLRRGLSLLSATVGLLAQVPPHATQLNPSASLLQPTLVRSGDTVHVIGITGGLNPGFVHYARSSDGGRTWPLREVPIGHAGALGPCRCEGDRVHVVVSSYWVGPYVISSHDGGTTWMPPVRVSLQLNSQFVSSVGMHVHGNTVNVVWVEPRAGGAVWANRSLDGGITWQANDTNLDVGPGAGAGNSAQLLGEGSVLHAFWTRTPAMFMVHQRSLDGGATWLPAAQVVSAAPFWRAISSASLMIAADAVPSGAFALQVRRSLDQGTTWTPVTGHGIADMLDFAIAGQTVLAVGKVGPWPVVTIQLNVSTDGGISWWPVPYTIPATRPLAATARVVGDALFMNITFPSGGGAALGAVIQSDDLGASWRAINGEAGLGLWTFTDSSFVVTKSSLNGTEVFAYVMEGHTVLGQGTAGTGAIVPVLRGQGLPGLGRTFSLDVESTRGGSVGAYYVTFGATATLSLGAATLYLQQPIGPFVFMTSGAPGAPGVGTANLPVTVPTSPSFAGLRLLSQAFVLDPVAPDGFAASRAVETWIR